MNTSVSKQALAVFLAIIIAAPAWGARPTVNPELPDPGHPSMSKQQQEQLGLKTAAEVYKQMPVLPDSSPITQYVQQLGKKLVTVIPPQNSWPYQFHVVQESDINAFALPGGPIFVNIGTINAADNEAQLAGVISHEMSHVYMQHSAKQAPKQEWASILSALGGALGGAAGSLAQMGIQLGAGTLLMKYSRGDEAQADAVGAIIMYKNGYDPRAMAEFFQKLEKMSGNGGPQFLSDHPNPGNRVEAVDKEIADWPPKQYAGDSPQFAQAKQEAKGIKAYTAQQISDGGKSGQWAQQNQKAGAIPPELQSAAGSANGSADGATLNNISYQQVQPSGQFQAFQASDFSISYPSNWKTAEGPNSATIAPPAGVGQNAIAYGVVVESAQNPDARSIDQATQALIQNLQQTNPGLRVAENPKQIQVAGTAGRSAMLQGTSPIQQGGQAIPERDWLVTVPRRQGGMLHIVFIAPENQFAQLQPTYQKMLDSLQVK
ncbi:MAG TPA: M48 family metallopeptidase [Terriglobales bacterium]|nr:M48 family metallopeptidase [Terriglobales bacterium]